jgi:hypothetical protein
MVKDEPRQKRRRRWWSQKETTDDIMHEVMDDELVHLLEEVEGEFQTSYEYHAQRLRELKDALRARKELDNG